MITKSIGKLTTVDVNTEIALYQKIEGFEVPQEVIDGAYKDKLAWIKAQRIDMGVEPVEINEEFFTLNPELPEDMKDIKVGDVVLIPIPKEETDIEKADREAAEAAQNGGGETPVMKKYKVLNDTGVTTSTGIVLVKDILVELDPESDETKGYIESGFIEEVVEATPGKADSNATNISRGQSVKEAPEAAPKERFYKKSLVLEGSVDTVVHNGRSYVDFQTAEGTMHRLPQDEFDAETGAPKSDVKED